MTRKEFVNKIQVFADTFQPYVRPACAHFVSRAVTSVTDAEVNMIQDVENLNYVPSVVAWGEKKGILTRASEKPKDGDLVIFDRTYDAVAPAGIGPEDDMTHIGIVLDAADTKYIHFSSSADAPVHMWWDTWPGVSKVFGFIDVFSLMKPEQEKVGRYSRIIDGTVYDVISRETTTVWKLLEGGKQAPFEYTEKQFFHY